MNKNVTLEPVTNESTGTVSAIDVTTENGNGESGTKPEAKGIVINNATKSGGSTVNSSTRSSAASNMNKGGGSKSKKEPKKVDRKKSTEIVDRYKEIDDTLDDL
jgi:hypothetical protein